MALRALSLCAGIGGIDLGLARWSRTVCFVEREAFPAACLVARMEEEALDRAPLWDDLRTFDARAWRGAVDLVAGGIPCQPHSVAGKQRGSADERDLWPEFRRILVECGAPLALIENVPGFVRSGGLEAVLGDLAALGFDAEWGDFRASDVGAPHRRERLFLLAHRRDDGRELLREAYDRDRRDAPGDELDGRDPAMADAGGSGRGQSGGGRETDRAAGPARRIESRRLGAALADAERDSLRLEPERAGERARSPIERNPEPGESSAGDVEHADEVRRRPRIGDLHARQSDTDGRCAHAFPPGPTDREGWERWIAAGGPQPVLRRGSDGVSAFVDRADRLRALGNAVVPACAELAFEQLARRVLGA